jgi:hypothetical protein
MSPVKSGPRDNPKSSLSTLEIRSHALSRGCEVSSSKIFPATISAFVSPITMSEVNCPARTVTFVGGLSDRKRQS